MSAILMPGGLPLPQTSSTRPAAVDARPPAAQAVLPQRALGRKPPPNANPRAAGLCVVVGLHLLLFWGLSSGLAKQAVELVKKPIMTTLIAEAPPPPPPPPPPKVEKIEQVLPKQPPPPAYVPPTETPVAAPVPPPPIQAVQSQTPVAPPPAVVAAPAPPAPAPAPVVQKREIQLACPGYEAILAQTLEEAIERVGLQGTVNTLIKIRGNQVVEVSPLSGPKEYHKYVVAAVKRMRCTAGGADEVQVSLPVIFS